ncbi:MAG: hypothetical protein ACC707_20195 [Thiohalomonadales bacterium]
MFINVNDHPSLVSAVNEATRLSAQGGSTIYVPGRVAPYDAKGIQWPENTQVFGDGQGVKITGISTISHVRGGEMLSLNFIDGINLLNCRSTHFKNIQFNGVVTLQGTSYYNVFDLCDWYKVGSVLKIIGQCNKNTVRDSRSSYSGNAVEFLPDNKGRLADGWKFSDTAFEGWTETGIGTVGAIIVRGKKHKFVDCWFEPGGNKDYLEYTVIFENDAYGCGIVDGFREWHFRVRDRSNSNFW